MTPSNACVSMLTLARRVNHSLEMISWIKARTEMSVLLSGFFVSEEDLFRLGLLMGIGGSVLFSTLRGQEEDQTGRSNEYFTVSILGPAVLAVLVWIVIAFFDRPLLAFFGAEGQTMTLALEYVRPIKFVVPCFLFTQTLAAYLRNDKNPTLATAGVLAGGIFNIFGDYFFVFTCDMGAFGAGLATAIGTVVAVHVVRMMAKYTKKLPMEGAQAFLR